MAPETNEIQIRENPRCVREQAPTPREGAAQGYKGIHIKGGAHHCGAIVTNSLTGIIERTTNPTSDP